MVPSLLLEVTSLALLEVTLTLAESEFEPELTL